jgi:hypothetical protein
LRITAVLGSFVLIACGGSPSSEGPPASDAAAPGESVSWVRGRSFPSFPPAERLDVADVSGASDDERYLLLSLQGLVNRTKPRIYLQENDAEGATFWLDMLHLPTMAIADPMSLVSKYAAEVRGLIVYDPALLHTVNLATTMAGVERGLVASPALAATLGAPPYNLPTIADLRTHGFADANAVYQYELTTYGTRTTNRLIVGLAPTISDCLRDYAVATEAMVVWLDSTDSMQRPLLASYLSGLERNAPYLGAWVDEPSLVAMASGYGVPVFAADFLRNLTVLSGVPRTIVPPAAPPLPMLENKAYVAIFMSDGDNVQEDQHLIPLKWADPSRGTVPISWTVQPGLVDIAPVILDYYYRTATPNDVLVSGPSGLGYTYPRDWPLLAFSDYTQRSADALDRAGLRVITVWNDGRFLTTSPQAIDYATDMPHLLGVTDQLGHIGGAPTLIGSSLPSLGFAASYGTSAADLETLGIDSALARWTHDTPLFVAVQGNMNQAAITPSTFLAVQQHYAGNPDVAFVRGDHLFQLIRQHAGLPIDP